MEKIRCELCDAAKEKDWGKCRDLLQRGEKTDYSDQIDGWNNTFRLAVAYNQVELVGLMMEKQPNNLRVVVEQMWKVISDSSRDGRLMFEQLFTGNPKASNLRGCFHFFRKQLRQATDCFYDRMTPIPSMVILVVRCIETMPPINREHTIFSLFGHYYGDLQGDVCVQIVFLLLANTAVYNRLIHIVISAIYIFQGTLCPQSAFELLQLLISAQANRPRFDLHEPIKSVASDLLSKFEACSEDLVSRLATVLDALEVKNAVLVKVIFCRPLWRSIGLLETIVQFMIDQCKCDADYKDEKGSSVLHGLLNGPVCKPVVRFLLDRGAHPCVRNEEGKPAFDLFPSVGLPFVGVRTLKCIAASKVAEAKIEHGEGDLPTELIKFVELH